METINLNLIPSGTNPVVHCSQYDEGRVFRFNLFDGSNVFTLDGTETIECGIKKPDGNIVTVAVTNTSDSYIDIVTTEQMCACGGNSFGTIKISKGDDNIYTLNFTLYCEPSPYENGIQSDSAIHNLNTMVDEMVAEDVAEQYDSANVIFDNAPTSGHGTPYTVTSEGIKTAIDNAFDYDNTASGSLVHIEDGADNVPVKSLASEIVAVESGSGEKSPTNPYTISGFASGVVSVCGVNLWDEVWELGIINSTTGANEVNNSYIRSKNYISIIPNTDYYYKTSVSLRLCYYDINKNLIGIANANNSIVTSPSNACFIRFYPNSSSYGTTYKNDISINYPSTDTQYHAYNGNTYTFTFGQTVYGGHFDNKGNLVITHKYRNLGDSNWNEATTSGSNKRFSTTIGDFKRPPNISTKGNIISNRLVAITGVQSYSGTVTGIALSHNSSEVFVSGNEFQTYDAITFKTLMEDYEVVYELATPITLAITSQDIPTLLGENNIFSNCGDVEVEYYTNKANDILDFIDSEIGKKNGTNILIEANSPDSIKTYVDNGLSGKADTSDTYTKTEVNNLLNDKQNSNVLNIVKHYDTGTSSDAITDIITEYGKVNMVFAFDVPLGYFTGCLTFANDNMGSGFIVLSTTGRFWVVSYVSGTITLTELT